MYTALPTQGVVYAFTFNLNDGVFGPPSESFWATTVAFQRCPIARWRYMRKRSARNMLASEPPTPDFSSISADRWEVVEGSGECGFDDLREGLGEIVLLGSECSRCLVFVK
jgi:hypothetical protein